MFLVMSLAVGLIFFTGMAPLPVAILFSLIVMIMLLIGWRAPTNVALAAGVTLWLGATLMFVISANTARTRMDDAVAQQFPGSELLDRIVTPMPSNPLCWEVMTVQQEGDNAVLRRAMLSLAPDVFAATECKSRSLDIPITAPLVPVTSADGKSLQWYGQISTPVDQLAHAVTSNCQAAAALRFIRAPWLATIEGERVLGDLRYDREVALGFAEVVLREQPDCPRFVPHWAEPRRDLIARPSH